MSSQMSFRWANPRWILELEARNGHIHPKSIVAILVKKRDICLGIVPTRNPDFQPMWLSIMERSMKI